MSIQSDSVLSAISLDGKPNSVPVADVLPDEFAQLDFDYVLDLLVELVFDPDGQRPYRVRIDLETIEACDTLAEGRAGVRRCQERTDRQQPGGSAMNLLEQAREAVQASRLAGLESVDSDTPHKVDLLAYQICQAAGVSIADIRVELWNQERQVYIASLMATTIPEEDEVPPAEPIESLPPLSEPEHCRIGTGRLWLRQAQKGAFK